MELSNFLVPDYVHLTGQISLNISSDVAVKSFIVDTLVSLGHGYNSLALDPMSLNIAERLVYDAQSATIYQQTLMQINSDMSHTFLNLLQQAIDDPVRQQLIENLNRDNLYMHFRESHDSLQLWKNIVLQERDYACLTRDLLNLQRNSRFLRQILMRDY